MYTKEKETGSFHKQSPTLLHPFTHTCMCVHIFTYFLHVFHSSTLKVGIKIIKGEGTQKK